LSVVIRRRAEYGNIVRRVDSNLTLKKYKVYLVIRNIITIFISMVITKENINQFIEGSSMDCSNKGITHIEYIPDGITRLYCWNNKLTELPKLPESLISLYCGDNKLTELPILPNSLIGLYCSNNQLTSLPKLPESLEYFSCQYNNLPYEITLNNLKEHNTLIKRKLILSRICV